MKHNKILKSISKVHYQHLVIQEPINLNILQEMLYNIRLSFSGAINRHTLEEEETVNNLDIPSYVQDRTNLKSDRVKVISDYKKAVDSKKLELIG